jgi:hypothetical protein
VDRDGSAHIDALVAVAGTSPIKSMKRDEERKPNAEHDQRNQKVAVSEDGADLLEWCHCVLSIFAQSMDVYESRGQQGGLRDWFFLHPISGRRRGRTAAGTS